MTPLHETPGWELRPDAWLEAAECRRRGIPVDEFVPPEGHRPTPAAIAACAACTVALPCGEARGNDVGLRGDGWRGGRNGERVRTCDDCGGSFLAAGGAIRRCEPCARRRRMGAA